MVCIAQMSATPLKHGRFNDPCGTSGENTLSYFSCRARSCSASYHCKAEAIPLKHSVLERYFQNLSHNTFLLNKKLLTAKLAAPPLQHSFNENCSYHLGSDILMDNYKALSQPALLSQFSTASN